MKLDLNNTSTILRSFVDTEGDDIHPDLPLRYKRQAYATALELLAEPMPSSRKLDELHEWALAHEKGLKTLLVHLWREAPPEYKDRTRQLLENHVRVWFERYYVPAEGAFSFYPDAEHATLDGTNSVIGLFHTLGAFSRPRQQRLWQEAERSGTRSGIRVSRITEKEVAPLMRCEGANSVRLFEPAPSSGSYTAYVAWVVYPKKTRYLDATDLLARLRIWHESTSQSMGNWVSRETILENLESAGTAAPKVITHSFPYGPANALLQQHKRVTVIAFDVLQVPRCQIDFTLEVEGSAPQP